MLQVEAYATVLSGTHFNWKDTKLPTGIGLNVKSAKHSWSNWHPAKATLCFHINKRPYQCQHCETSFRYETNWKEHLISFHDPRESPCSQCPLALKSKYRLVAHIKISHGEKSQRLFKCERCSFETSNSDTRKKHKTTYSDLKPHKWPLLAVI